MNTQEIPQEPTFNMIQGFKYGYKQVEPKAQLSDKAIAEGIASLLYASPPPPGHYDHRGTKGNALTRNFRRLLGEFKYAWKATEYERKDYLSHPWDTHKLMDWAKEFTDVSPYWVSHAIVYTLFITVLGTAVYVLL